MKDDEEFKKYRMKLVVSDRFDQLDKDKQRQDKILESLDRLFFDSGRGIYQPFELDDAISEDIESVAYQAHDLKTIEKFILMLKSAQDLIIPVDYANQVREKWHDLSRNFEHILRNHSEEKANSLADLLLDKKPPFLDAVDISEQLSRVYESQKSLFDDLVYAYNNLSNPCIDNWREIFYERIKQYFSCDTTTQMKRKKFVGLFLNEADFLKHLKRDSVTAAVLLLECGKKYSRKIKGISHFDYPYMDLSIFDRYVRQDETLDPSKKSRLQESIYLLKRTLDNPKYSSGKFRHLFGEEWRKYERRFDKDS